MHVDPEHPDVAVVPDEYGNIEALLQFFLEWHVLPPEIGREHNPAGVNFDSTGSPQASVTPRSSVTDTYCPLDP